MSSKVGVDRFNSSLQKDLGITSPSTLTYKNNNNDLNIIFNTLNSNEETTGLMNEIGEISSLFYKQQTLNIWNIP